MCKLLLNMQVARACWNSCFQLLFLCGENQQSVLWPAVIYDNGKTATQQKVVKNQGLAADLHSHFKQIKHTGIAFCS